MVASPVVLAQSNWVARINQQVPSLHRNLRELEMLGQGVGRGLEAVAPAHGVRKWGDSFRTGDHHRYGGGKKGARVLPRPRLAQKGLRAGRHRSFVGHASVGHDRDRAREVHQRVVEIERITPDVVRADLELVLDRKSTRLNSSH